MKVIRHLASHIHKLLDSRRYPISTRLQKNSTYSVTLVPPEEDTVIAARMNGC